MLVLMLCSYVKLFAFDQQPSPRLYFLALKNLNQLLKEIFERNFILFLDSNNHRKEKKEVRRQKNVYCQFGYN